MFHVLALVISIGLADGINLTSIGPALFLASEPNPRRSVMQFTAGYVLVLLLGGLLLILGPGRAILALAPSPTVTTRYVLETIAGVAMLIASPVLWLGRERLAKRHGTSDRSPSHRPPFLLGAGISGVELPTAFPYFAAIAAIVGSGQNVLTQGLLVVLYDVCFSLPLLAILVVLAVAGEQSVDILTRIRDYWHRHWPSLAAGVALVAGIFVTTLGVTGLLSHVGGSTGAISRRVRHLLTHLR